MSFSHEQLWQQLSSLIIKRISQDGYRRWFQDVSISAQDKKSVTLSVPNPIHQFFIESNYTCLLLDALQSIPGVTATSIKIEPRQNDTNSSSSEARESSELLPNNLKLPAPAPTAPSSPQKRVVSKKNTSNLQLNPSYTFESFVVGSNNQFAHAAASAVAEAPSRTYNPLFIYGESGLGKTHLLQAIGHYVQAHKKRAKIVYLSSEQFINEFIDAVQHGSLFQFRKRYRQADLLMIDDIQFFAGKGRSQEEFFHTFGALHDAHKQIVLTSDRPPSEIQNLEKRLVSRFEWGMTAEVQPPDIETRIAILHEKADRLHLSLENWVLETLANYIQTDIRRLEGALMRVAAYQSLSKAPLEKETLDHLLRDIIEEQGPKKLTIEQIQRHVADHYDIRLADMSSRRRQSCIAAPRQLAMYLAREKTAATLKEIGEAFGGKDHGTVLHACRSIKKKLSSDPQLRHDLKTVETSFLSTSS